MPSLYQVICEINKEDDINSVYRYNLGRHQDINRHLSGTMPKGVYTEADYKKEILDHIPKIDRFMRNHKTKEPTILHRGIASSPEEEHQPGQVFTSKGYLSTSKLPEVAEHFSKLGAREGVKPSILRITVPKNHPHIDMNAALAPHDVYFHQKEQEVLLPRNSKYKITKREETPTHHLLHIDALPIKERK